VRGAYISVATEGTIDASGRKAANVVRVDFKMIKHYQTNNFFFHARKYL
jgi:hypothetical protein